MFRTGLWLGVALLAVACTPPVTTLQPAARPLPARLELVFHSQLPELYYVLSGPAYTYGRFRVNAEFAGFLQQQLQAASPPGAAPEAILEVELISLTTDFNEVGAGPPASQPGRLAMLDEPSRQQFLQVVADLDMNGDFNLPETTIKQATMTYRVRLLRGERVLSEEVLQAHYSERFDWYFDHPAMQNWARYDYGTVLKGLYRQAWRELRAYLDRNPA